MTKKIEAKKEVYFIATKYKNRKASVSFYTKEGKSVPENSVAKTDVGGAVGFYTNYSLE
ncbi:MAG: hypothetical protein Q8L28_01455 [bacterium]|nr:hypothetical protein [bacterium]